MKPKRLVTGILLLFVLGSLAYLAVQRAVSAPASDSAAAPAAAEVAGAPGTQIVAYYFHGRARCVTCQRLESYAREAIETGFARELGQGLLSWQSVDITQPENRHFATDYRLQYQSVVLVEITDGQRGRWRNLDRIWELVRNKKTYVEYVQGQVQEFLSQTAGAADG